LALLNLCEQGKLWVVLGAWRLWNPAALFSPISKVKRRLRAVTEVDRPPACVEGLHIRAVLCAGFGVHNPYSHRAAGLGDGQHIVTNRPSWRRPAQHVGRCTAPLHKLAIDDNAAQLISQDDFYLLL
jgi:hypothetical protein